MIILMKGLNEELYVERCISDFVNEPFVDKIVVVDGDSTDLTVYKVKQFPKTEIHVHKWLHHYHYQEVIQSMICLSYVPNGELFFIIDFDERMSDELKQTLNAINRGELFIPDHCAIHFPRRTFDVIRYENSPYAIVGDDGWPIPANQIGQYPDYQCRMMRKSESFHWINSPHHIPCGHKTQMHLNGDILHYEKNDLRERKRIEIGWARNQASRRELGLSADSFETKIKPEISEAFDPEYWKGVTQ